MTGTPTYCAHCGRVTRTPHGGWASVAGVPVCHPNVPDRPDCYRQVTVHGEPLGSRKSTPQPAPMPLIPLILFGVVIGVMIIIAIVIIVK
jgi:hypothetical protein